MRRKKNREDEEIETTELHKEETYREAQGDEESVNLHGLAPLRETEPVYGYSLHKLL